MYFWKNPPACLSWYRAFRRESILLPPGKVEMMELVTDSWPDPAEEGRDLTSDSGISESTGVLVEEEGLAEDGRTEPPEEVRLGEDIDTGYISYLSLSQISPDQIDEKIIFLYVAERLILFERKFVCKALKFTFQNKFF